MLLTTTTRKEKKGRVGFGLGGERAWRRKAGIFLSIQKLYFDFVLQFGRNKNLEIYLYYTIFLFRVSHQLEERKGGCLKQAPSLVAKYTMSCNWGNCAVVTVVAEAAGFAGALCIKYTKVSIIIIVYKVFIPYI